MRAIRNRVCGALGGLFTLVADVGIDLGTPVVEAIGAEHASKFSGHIPKVTVEVRK